MKQVIIRNDKGRMIGQITKMVVIRDGHFVERYHAVALVDRYEARTEEFVRVLNAARWIKRTVK